MATIGTTGSGTIARTPQDVWDFIVDPAFLHHWVKDIEPGGTWLDGETPGVVGSRYRVDYSYGRRTNEIVFEMISRLDSRFTATMFILTGGFASWFKKRQLNKELIDLQRSMRSQ